MVFRPETAKNPLSRSQPIQRAPERLSRNWTMGAGQRLRGACRRTRPAQRLVRREIAANLTQSPDQPSDVPMYDASVATAEREAALDATLTALWKGQLTREAAVGRIVAELGMGQRAAQDEIDGFLRD